ncbi:MAG: ArnT family glycosyltransferase [Guyparkeria sp.]|uniref:ArnT family glycosyltransferase n=1 Tax=Guyparkeria sp. TaxID=2035736 RepID=UPI003979BD30
MSQQVPDNQTATDWLDRRHVHVLVLGLAVAIGYVWGIGTLPLFDLDEGAFTGATWAMFERGDFLVPYLNDEPRFAKPVLIYWLQAPSVAVFGFHEWAFRLPSVLASTLWVAMIYLFADRYLNPRAAFFATLIPATAMMTTVVGKAAISDAVLLLFLTGAVFATFNHWVSGERRWIRWAYLAMALGFLTKGPVAVVIPAATSFLFYLMTGKGRAWWRAVLDWQGLLLFVVVAVPWYVLVWLEYGQLFIDEFFLKNNLGRFDEPMEGHSGGYWYYPVVTFVALLPFTGAVLTSLRHFRSDWVNPLQAPGSLPLALRRFGWIWFLVTLLLFTFSGTKLPHYLGYGLVGLMLVMGSHLPQVRSRALHLLPVAAFLLFVLALPTLVNLYHDQIKPSYVQDMLAERDRYFGAAWYVVAGLSLLLVLLPLASRRWPLPNVLVPAALSFAIVVNALVLHAVGQMQQGPIREAGLMARDLSGDLVMRGMNTPSFGVYAQRVVERRDPRAGDLLLTRNKHASGIPGEILYARGGVVLVRVGEDDPAAGPAD